jgi:hypothetical protein
METMPKESRNQLFRRPRRPTQARPGLASQPSCKKLIP